MKHAHSIYLSRSDAREGDTPIYETIINYLSSGYAVIYAAESNQSQVISRIKEVVAAKVKDNNNNLNIESLLQNGTFTIFDSESIYSFEKTKLEPQRLLNFWYSIIREKLGKENSNLKGILAIGTAKVFLDTGNLENLLIYEDMIGKTFDMPFEGICYYDLQSISQLSLQNIISLLNMHQSTIHRGWQYKEWSQEDIIRLISAGLDNILGGGLSKIVLATLGTIYKIDINTIVTQPVLFEAAIRKALGDSAAKMVFSAIKDIIKNEMVY